MKIRCRISGHTYGAPAFTALFRQKWVERECRRCGSVWRVGPVDFGFENRTAEVDALVAEIAHNDGQADG